MIGIERAPVCGNAVVRVPRLALVEKFHALVIHRVGAGGDAARPGERERGVAAFGIRENSLLAGALPTTVDLHEAREVFGVFRKSINPREHRFFAFENADAKTHDPHDNTVLFPFLEHLDIERFLARIEAHPKFVEIFRSDAIDERGEGFLLGRGGNGQGRSGGNRAHKGTEVHLQSSPLKPRPTASQIQSPTALRAFDLNPRRTKVPSIA